MTETEEPGQRTATLEITDGQVVLTPLWGPQDAHRRLLERRLDVKLRSKDHRISVTGTPARVAFALRALEALVSLIRSGAPVFLQDLEQAIGLLEADGTVKLDELHGKPVFTTFDRRGIAPKSPNQKVYLDAMATNDLVFGMGPAGTGKTYLAMAAAVAALRNHQVERIVLVRPAVEAGERLGFLPGSLVEKINPYLRPLYDALFDFMGMEPAGKLIENGTVEVAPLAFMRGRTLNRSFIILDEAQNSTPEQMKMFLTRLGHSSKAVVTGDVTQTDLPRNQPSGLTHAVRLLGHLDGISVVRLTRVDVVRHPLVRAIVQAYEDAEARENER